VAKSSISSSPSSNRTLGFPEYGFPKADILKVLEKILRTAEFEISEKDLLWLALADYRSGKGDFSDYCLGRANERAGAKVTLSFDSALKGEPRFQILA